MRLFGKREFSLAALEVDRSARHGQEPAINRSSEVLPAPFGPMTASASPEEASKSRPEKISRPPAHT